MKWSTLLVLGVGLLALSVLANCGDNVSPRGDAGGETPIVVPADFPSDLNPIVLGSGTAAEREGAIVIRGCAGSHAESAITASIATWYNASTGAQVGAPAPAFPSIISWAPTTITRVYTAVGVGNFADRCTFSWECVSFDSGSAPPVGGGVAGLQSVLRNTGGTCSYFGIGDVPVASKHFFIYSAAPSVGHYIEVGYGFARPSTSGVTYSIDLNANHNSNGHFN